MPRLLARSFHFLLARRRQPKPFLLLIAAIPLALSALMGAEEGGLIPYTVYASICILQAIYPTLLGWILVLAIYCVGSAIYLFAAANDLIDVALGKQATISSDFVTWCEAALVTLALSAVLSFNRPQPRFVPG